MSHVRRQRGFTLMEMSVVLVIIAVILGAVTVGRDVYRSGVAERINSDFIQGWLLAYDRYLAQSGTVPNDPTYSGLIGGSTGAAPLCGDELLNQMLARGVALPAGAFEGRQDTYAYQDRNGLTQRLQVCLMAVKDWAEPVSTTSYIPRSRNVMRISNLTPELANQLDQRIDGGVDARFGRVREVTRHNTTSVSLTADAGKWSRNEHPENASHPEARVETVNAYIKLGQ